MLSVTIDTREAERMLKNVAGGLERVTRDAINDTVKHVRSEASKDIRSKWAVQKKDLDKHLQISERATLKKLRAELAAEGISLPLVLFNPRVVKGKGVRVALHKGKMTVVSGAFMATMKSGHTGVFRRPFRSRREPAAKPYQQLPVRTVKTGDWRGTAYRPSLPITEAHTIEIGSMWKPYIYWHIQRASDYVQVRLFSRLERLIETGR